MDRTVEDVKNSLQSFGRSDYLVFGLMLVISTGIGFYFRPQKRQQANRTVSRVREYLIGGGNLSIFPVSMSLIASALSSVGIIGFTTEGYLFGVAFFIGNFGLLFNGVIMHFLVLPVFHDLKLLSMYEYMELRFNRSVRLLGSIIYCLSMLFRLPLIAYVTSMAFNQMTGADLYITYFIATAFCICYTCIGGIRAVVWTDVFQSLMMVVFIVFLLIFPVISVGGLGVVIERNLNSTRIESPIFNLDPRIRISFWSSTVGMTIYSISYFGLEQSMIQRYISLSSLKKSRIALWILTVGFILIVSCSLFVGLTTYAFYHDCDPISTGLVKRVDQLLPLLASETMGKYPLLCGFFVAGLFSAALSTISTGLNSLSAVILQDFVKLAVGDRFGDKWDVHILRAIVVVIGLISIGVVFVIEQLGAILTLSMAIISAACAPLLGIFIIGLCMPWIGSKPTLVGAVIGLVFSCGLVLKVQVDTAAGLLHYETKPVSTEGCSYSFNQTITPRTDESDKKFYHISFQYYTLFVVLITIIVANLMSLVFGKHDFKEADIKLLTPPIRKWYTSNRKQSIQLSSNIKANEPLL